MILCRFFVTAFELHKTLPYILSNNRVDRSSPTTVVAVSDSVLNLDQTKFIRQENTNRKQ